MYSIYRSQEMFEKCKRLGVELRITEGDAFLPEFYERFGFQREKRVILLGKEL